MTEQSGLRNFDAFLSALAALSAKHGITISGLRVLRFADSERNARLRSYGQVRCER